MGDAYVCVHAHFYQPPRENPWLEEVEPQASADPFHDWNGRITAECYGPNATARLLDDENRIVAIRNNYERISFNFGPTLLSWMARHEPATYTAILEADRRSLGHFGGHGSALAQPYHHTILPLATARDRRTEVAWGVADFRHRFGREPEGMWLPETAVCLDTLEALAEHGIRFTVLAPHQASRTRALGAAEWSEVDDGGIDTRVAYLQRLPSGRQIDLFFYDGDSSTAVAFKKLLDDGVALADRLASTIREGPGPRLAHISTDGETYGHHHAHGEMALAEALRRWEEDPDLRLTNYGRFLEEHPPAFEVEIREHSSWSCAHGLERWQSDCGCASGGHPDWNQAWRRPLRVALDGLAADLAAVFEREAGPLLGDPWAARDAYVDVLREPGCAARKAFLGRHARRGIGPDDAMRLFDLLEMQRHALLMFTSCGWFFDDLAGLETRQIIAYAARALDLADSVGAGELREPFLERLAEARANGPEAPDGRELLERDAERLRVTPRDLAVAHAAAETAGAEPLATGAWRVESEQAAVTALGRRSVAGVVQVTNRRTGERSAFDFRGLTGHLRLAVRMAAAGSGSSSVHEVRMDGTASTEELRPEARERVRAALTLVAPMTAGQMPAGELEQALRVCATRPGEPHLARRAAEIAARPQVGEPTNLAEMVAADLVEALDAQLEGLIGSDPTRAGELLATTELLLGAAEAIGIAPATRRIRTRWWEVLEIAAHANPVATAAISARLGFVASLLTQDAGGRGKPG